MSGPRPPRLDTLTGTALPPFTPTIVEWVRWSIEQLPDDRGILTKVFYQELFTLCPEARAMFAEDMTPQQDRLLSALLAVANAMDRPREPIETALRRWGAVHRRVYGVTDEQYVYIGQALVRTITRILTSTDSMVHSSWVAVYYWMAAVMIDGADQAEAVDRDPILLLQGQLEPVQEPLPAIATVTPIRSHQPSTTRVPRRASNQ